MSISDFNLEKQLFDIAIVGGSFSGLSSAIKASENGSKVVILEKKLEIDSPIRTSGGSWIKNLKDLGITDDLWNPIRKIRFFSPNRNVQFDYFEPEACVLNIRKLIQFLATRALNNKAILNLGANVTKVTVNEKDYVAISYSKFGREHVLYSKLVIDASGHNSFVAKSVGLSQGFKRMGFGAEYEGICEDFPQDESWLLLGSEFSPKGYSYIFSSGENKVRIGVDLIDPKNGFSEVNQYLLKFISEDKRVYSYTKNFKPMYYHFGVVPSGKVLVKTVSNRTIIVGDSAGQVSYITGEGIRYAIEMGYYAGEAADKAVKANDFSEHFLAKNYDSIWKRKYLKKFELATLINRKISETSDNALDRGVDLYLKKLSPARFADLLKLEFSLKDKSLSFFIKLFN